MGRKRQRAKNRESYISAVLDEQQRQRQVAEQQGVAYVLDAEALAAFAVAVSEADVNYAHILGKLYYEEDCAADQYSFKQSMDAAAAAPPPPIAPMLPAEATPTTVPQEAQGSSGEEDPQQLPPRCISVQFTLNDERDSYRGHRALLLGKGLWLVPQGP